MFLTADDLIALTGFKKPALQRRWLLEQGYRFDVRRDGRPALLKAQVTARQLKGLGVKTQLEQTPDFEALET